LLPAMIDPKAMQEGIEGRPFLLGETLRIQPLHQVSGQEFRDLDPANIRVQHIAKLLHFYITLHILICQ